MQTRGPKYGVFPKEGSWHPIEEERLSPKHTEEMTAQSLGNPRVLQAGGGWGGGRKGLGHQSRHNREDQSFAPLLAEPRQRRQQGRSHTGRLCRHLCPEQLSKDLPNPSLVPVQ